MVQLPRFLPHSRCTRRTDDSGSSVSEKPFDQRPPGTADRRRQASPHAPGTTSVRWRGSLRKTWSSEPNGISTPPRPPQLASRRRALSLAVVTAVLSVAVVTTAVARLYSTPANDSLLNGSLLGPTSHACNGLNKIGRFCRLVPPVRAESKG